MVDIAAHKKRHFQAIHNTRHVPLYTGYYCFYRRNIILTKVVFGDPFTASAQFSQKPNEKNTSNIEPWGSI